MDETIAARLKVPVDPALLKSLNVGRGTIVYIPGHTVIDQLNSIFGEDGWSHKILRERMRDLGAWANPLTGEVTNEGRIYEATVQLDIHPGGVPFCSHVDTGSFGVVVPKDGHAPGPDAHEMARKGATTDALKRASRCLGPAFANHLYDKAEAADVLRDMNIKQAQPARPTGQRPPAQQQRPPAQQQPPASRPSIPVPAASRPPAPAPAAAVPPIQPPKPSPYTPHPAPTPPSAPGGPPAGTPSTAAQLAAPPAASPAFQQFWAVMQEQERSPLDVETVLGVPMITNGVYDKGMAEKNIMRFMYDHSIPRLSGLAQHVQDHVIIDSAVKARAEALAQDQARSNAYTAEPAWEEPPHTADDLPF